MGPRAWAGQARGGGRRSKKHTANAIVLFLELHTQAYLLCLVTWWGFLFAPPLPHPRPSLSRGPNDQQYLSFPVSAGAVFDLFAFAQPTKGQTKVEVMKSRSTYLTTWCVFAWVANAIGSTRNMT